MNHEVPFYSNTPDDLHCYEASLKMMLKYFEPDKDYSWDELDKITGKTPGFWTWSQQSSVWLQDQGYKVINIETFDYPRFVAEGSNYLIEFYGSEVAAEQIKHSDITREQQTCKRFLEVVKTELRLPTWPDIETLLSQGYLIGCLVNSAALDGKSGYVGHFVVLKGIDDETVTVHDPGLPALENRQITKSDFEKAWGYPNENAKNLTAMIKS